MSQEYFDIWRKRPELFFKDVLGVDTLEDYQTNLLHEIVKHKRVAIKACHSVGKTWTMARVALWFFGCYKNSIVISTAPSFKQVEMLLWGELRDAHKNAKMKLGGKLLATRLTKSDKWYCMGFSPKKEAGENNEQLGSNFQGFHADHVLIIFDEATGIPPDIWKMAEGLMTSGITVKFVAIANPTTRGCRFFECFSSASWRSLTLTCFDSPNLKANGFNSVDDVEIELERLMLMTERDRFAAIAEYKKPKPHLLSAEWVIEYCLEWGIEHPLVVSKAFGQFPLEDDSVLIKMRHVTDAQEREALYSSEDARSIGVDVARSERGDKSVITELVGSAQTDNVVLRERDLMMIAGSVVQMINNEHKQRRTVVLVDATGIGSGVIDSLRESQRDGVFSHEVEIIEIHFGSTNPNLECEADDKELCEENKKRYADIKSRMFQNLANDIRDCLSIFDEKQYLKELPTLKTKITSASKLRVESKEDYKTRTGQSSPDWSDALALANLGRYVKISYGSFVELTKNKSDSKPRVRQSNRKEYKSKIKITEY